MCDRVKTALLFVALPPFSFLLWLAINGVAIYCAANQPIFPWWLPVIGVGSAILLCWHFIYQAIIWHRYWKGRR